MEQRSKLPKWVIAALILPALLSLFSIYRRYQAESLNRATAFAADYETIESLAASQGLTVEKAIEQLKPQGLNAVVLSEESVGELIGQGRITLVPQSVPNIQNAQGTIDSHPQFSFHFAGADGTRSRVWRGLEIRLGALAGPMPSREDRTTSEEGSDLALPNVSMAIIRSTAVGLNPDEAKIAKDHGLLVIARCGNPGGVSAKAVEQTLMWAHDLGASVFLPAGEQVLGRKDALMTTVAKLQELGIRYATPEFAKIGGDDLVVKKAPENVIRLHSAQVAELDKLTPADAVERYVKAARERNMRILLIRPESLAADQPLTDYGDFLGKIREGIEKQGGVIGVPKPFDAPNLPRFLLILIGLSIMPAAWFVFAAFLPQRKVQLALAVVLGLLGLASAVHTGLKIDAMIASLIFPVAAFLVLDALRPRNVFVGFLLTSAISLIGGLCVAGMLNGLPYYVKADDFSGVKISIFLPLLVVGAMFLARMADMRQILKNPILWGTALLGVVIAAVLLIMIMRTGNDSEVGASPLEMVFRNVLDRILFVRPRTKEFLIGHPLLFVGIGLLSYVNRNPKRVAKWGGWVALFLMVGAMGQTDIVNTLTHLHIPVVLSLARIALGLVLGCIIGGVLWAIVARLLPKGEEETSI